MFEDGRLNVLHVVLSLDIGGLERVVLDMLRHVSDRIRPFLCCLEKVGDGHDEVERLHIPMMEIGGYGRHKFRTVQKLAAYIRTNNIDVVHCHNFSPHFYGTMAGLVSGVPAITTKHGSHTLNPHYRFWLNRVASLFSKKIVCVSNDAQVIARQEERDPAKKLITILNGIDTDRFCGTDKGIKGPYPPKGENRVIGIVARLSAEKDHKTLINAFSIVKKTINDVVLLVVGDGPALEANRLLARTLGLDNSISFLGSRHDIPELMASMDIFVLSSLSEGISLTLLEAMASRLPIVCTNVGGNPEVVADGKTGYIVPPYNPIAMAEKIIALLQDRLLRENFGNAGLARAIDQFSIKAVMKRYEKIYMDVA